MKVNLTQILTIFFPFFVMSCICPDKGIRLSSNIVYDKFQFNSNNFYCKGLGAIKTRDKGYLTAGVETYSYKSYKGNISLSKYDLKSNLQYKNQNFPSFEDIIFYRLQETNSYYYLIMALKLKSSSPYNIQIYRIGKNGTIIQKFPFDEVSTNECGLLILIMKDDDILISACNYIPSQGEYITYTIYNINTASTINRIKLGGPPCIVYCNTFILKSVAINPIDQVVLFEGNINSVQKCSTCVLCPNSYYLGPHCHSSSGTPVEYNYYQIFNSKFFEIGNNVIHSLANDPKGGVPPCADFTSGKVIGTGRDEIYLFLSVYHSQESSFIAMEMSGFDILYVIIDNSQNIGPRQIFKKPGPININQINSFIRSKLIFDDPYFIFAGIGQAYSTNAIIVGAYHSISNTGFVKYFPESLPGVCTGINCNFEVSDVTQILTSNFIVSGWSWFPRSLNNEWIRLIYDLTPGNLVSTQRIVNNLNFEAIGIMYLSDFNLLEYGNDIYALALVKYKSNFDISQEARIDLYYSLKIFTIVASASCLFAGGSIEKYDNSGKYGIIVSISDTNFQKLSEYIFPAYSELIKMVLSSTHSIYGIGNYINRPDSFLFNIETSLKPNYFENVEFFYTFLSDLKETKAKQLVIVGQNKLINIMFIALFNLKLQLEISFPNLKQFLHFNTKIVLLNSVAITNENNIMAVGSIPDKSGDCITILFSKKLEAISYKYFGTNDIDDSFHVLSMDDGHIFITGIQSVVSFVSLFTRQNNLIKEFILPFEQLKLISSMEKFYRHEISVGYQLIGNFKEMRLFTITIDITCPLGYKEDLDSPICTEICGDNRNYGTFECDNYDRECCTENCTLTPYYSIVIDPITKQEICRKEYVVNANYNMSKNQVIISFSNKMSFCDKILSGELTLEDLKKSGQIFAKNNSRKKGKIIITDLNLNLENCDNLTITLQNKNSILEYSKFLDIDLKGEFFTDVNNVLLSNHFASFKINYPKDPDLNNSDESSIANRLRIVFLIGLASSMVSAFLGTGILEIFSFIGPLQIIILFSLINIQQFPTKALNVVSANSIISLNFDVINKNIFFLIENETGVSISSTRYIDDNSKNHPSLNLANIYFNLGSKIFIIIIYSSYFLGLYLLSNKIRTLDKYLNSFTWNGFIKLFHSVYFEFFICSLMQFFHQNYLYFWFNNLENVLANISVAAIFIYCIKIFGILKYLTPKECVKTKVQNRIGALYPHTRSHLLLAKYQILVFYFRRFLSILFLFAFMRFPMIQAIIFSLVSFFNLLFLIFVKHEDDRIRELSNMLIEILIMTLHIDFIILVYLHKTNNYYYDSLVDFFVYVAQISTFLKSGFSLVNSIYSIIQYIKKLYTKPRLQNIKNPKINDISKEMSDHTTNFLAVTDNLSFHNKGNHSTNVIEINSRVKKT